MGIVWYHYAKNTKNINIIEHSGISRYLLNIFLYVHIIPINRVVFPDPKSTHLEDSFPLICFQRLSILYIATQRLLLEQ